MERKVIWAFYDYQGKPDWYLLFILLFQDFFWGKLTGWGLPLKSSSTIRSVTDLMKTIRCYLILNCWSALCKTHHFFLSKLCLVNISAFSVAAGKLPFLSLNLDVLCSEQEHLSSDLGLLLPLSEKDRLEITKLSPWSVCYLWHGELPTQSQSKPLSWTSRGTFQDKGYAMSWSKMWVTKFALSNCKRKESAEIHTFYSMAFLCLFYIKVHPVSFQFGEPFKVTLCVYKIC